MVNKLFILVKLSLFCTLFLSSLNAQSIHNVISTADSGAGSLRQSILDASSGDIIRFDSSISGDTIVFVSSINIDKNLTIEGNSTNYVTADGNNLVRHFIIFPLYYNTPRKQESFL